MDVEVQATEQAAEVVARMSTDLELWASDVEAALFLAGLALAHGSDPVEADEGEPVDVTLGHIGDAGEAAELDALAILGVVEDAGDDLEAALADALPGWIEAGAEIAEPHLKDSDPVEASAEILALIRDVG